MKVLLLACALLLFGSRLQAQTPPDCPPPASHIDVESGSFSTQPGATFKLTHFSADLVPEGATAPMCYGKSTVVAHGEILADDQSLTKVFTTKLTKGKSKIKNFKVLNEPGKVTLTGTLKKVVPVKFTIEGTIATDGTSISLHTETFKADGVPVKGLLELFGKDLSSIIKVKGVQGVSIKQNTISFRPDKLADLKGHIAAVSTIDGALMLRYGSAADAPAKSEQDEPSTPAPAPSK